VWPTCPFGTALDLGSCPRQNRSTRCACCFAAWERNGRIHLRGVFTSLQARSDNESYIAPTLHPPRLHGRGERIRSLLHQCQREGSAPVHSNHRVTHAKIHLHLRLPFSVSMGASTVRTMVSAARLALACTLWTRFRQADSLKLQQLQSRTGSIVMFGRTSRTIM
jgi:hypothetical protein